MVERSYLGDWGGEEILDDDDDNDSDDDNYDLDDGDDNVNIAAQHLPSLTSSSHFPCLDVRR